MRILMITDVYFPRINGVSTSIETFRNDLQQHAIDVTLVAPEYPQHQAAPSASSPHPCVLPAARDVNWLGAAIGTGRLKSA